ncbi:energy transducer TonB (plasmid) [Ideonella dechloratans]|nr:energy transducer TonB [Ideonella dechloratans]UFU11996.1 energy transducer TonB [Ideonella dechloratans]
MSFATVPPPPTRPSAHLAAGTGRRRVVALAAVALVHGVLAAAIWGPGVGGRSASEPAAPSGQLVMLTLPLSVPTPTVPAARPGRGQPPAEDRGQPQGALSAPVAPAPAVPMLAAQPPAIARVAQASPVVATASSGPAPASHAEGTPGQAVAKAASAATPLAAAGGANHGARAMPGNALPPYPEAAREDGLEGLVRLAVEVDAQGRVSAVRWDARSGVMLLDIAARDAVRLWRFEPARQDGQAVASTVRVALQFRLDAPVGWVAQADTR